MPPTERLIRPAGPAGGRYPILGLAAAIATLMLGVGPAAAAGLGTPPSTYQFSSRCAHMSLSPNVVSIGHDITGSAGPPTDQCGGPASKVAWGWTPPPLGLKVVSGCGPNASSCVLKAISSTNAWAEGCINGTSGFGGWDSCDYYAVLAKDQYDLSGTISASKTAPGTVSGLTVTADGPGGHQSTRTDTRGDFAFAVKKGTYTVAVAKSALPVRRVVAVTHDTTGVDFRLAIDQLSLRFAPGAVTADGAGHFVGSARDLTAGGNPLAGEPIALTPPLTVVPRALVCTPSGLVSPTLLSDGSPLGSAFTRSTDGGGLIPLSVWVGTVPGDWLLTAAESMDASVTTSLSLPFGAGTGAAFTPGAVPEQFYGAVRGTIAGGGINLFHDFAGIGQVQASDQAILIAFLDQLRGAFPGADFGPVHAGGLAGIVFYRHGTTDPSSGSVLSIDQAADIVAAAGAGQPLPAADQALPSLGGWAQSHGSTVAATLGSLVPPPQERLLYFGFPYPPVASSAAAAVAFYGPCLAPDPALQELQTHSPVALVLTGAGGYRFGLDARGRRTGTGTGLILRQGDVTTYVVPAASYRVSAAATGTGPATIVALTPGPRAERAQTYALSVRRGATSSLSFTPAGAGGSLRLGDATARVTHGLPLTLRGLPRRLTAGRRVTLALRLSSLGAPLAGAIVSVAGDARAGTISNGAGLARLTLRPRAGRLKVTVAAPGVATATHILVVRP